MIRAGHRTGRVAALCWPSASQLAALRSNLPCHQTHANRHVQPLAQIAPLFSLALRSFVLSVPLLSLL